MILNKIYGNKFRRTKRNRNKKSVLTLNLTLQHKNSNTTKYTYKYRKHKASNDAYILKHIRGGVHMSIEKLAKQKK